MKAKRSKGVTVIAVFLVLFSLHCFVSSVSEFIASSSLSNEEYETLAKDEGWENGSADQLRESLRSSGISNLVETICSLVLGIGLLKRKNWARILVICVCIVLLLIWIFDGFLTNFNDYHIYFKVLGILLITSCISAIVFLLNPKVKAGFKFSQTEEATTVSQKEQKE